MLSFIKKLVNYIGLEYNFIIYPSLFIDFIITQSFLYGEATQFNKKIQSDVNIVNYITPLDIYTNNDLHIQLFFRMFYILNVQRCKNILIPKLNDTIIISDIIKEIIKDIKIYPDVCELLYDIYDNIYKELNYQKYLYKLFDLMLENVTIT